MADPPFRMQHTDKSFSVKVFGWNSPRMVAFVDGFVYFQASTCYPCQTCNYRVEALKRALETGPHSRSGLWGNEVVLNVDGPRTYNLVKIDGQAFFVLPYAGEDNPKAIAAFLSQILKINATIAGGYGISVQLPLVSEVYDVDPGTLSQTELLDGVKRLQDRLLPPVAPPPSGTFGKGAVVDDGFMKYQAKNQYLLIAALVLHKMDVEKALNSLIEFAKACPEEERQLFRSFGGVGGEEARKAEAVLHGYYYNTDTILYLLHSSPVPFMVAGDVKKAYDLTICSHLNDDLDLGERYFNTTYYHLLTTPGTSGISNVNILAQGLSLEVQKALSGAPSTLTSDAEKAVWLYTLQDPPVYQTLSGALCNDKESELKPWMPLILLIKRYASSHPMQEDILTYRSSRMTKFQFDALRKGAVYRDPKFVSTTKNEEFAKYFGRVCGRDYMCEFGIKKNCANAVTLTLQTSRYKEKEVLLAPYSPLLVIRKDEKKKLVQFTVLGDEAAKKHLESGDGRNNGGVHVANT